VLFASALLSQTLQLSNGISRELVPQIKNTVMNPMHREAPLRSASCIWSNSSTLLEQNPGKPLLR